MLPITFMALIEDKNDRTIFKEVYNTSRTMLLSFAKSLLNDESLAEDAVSESFFKLAKSFHKVHTFEVPKIIAYIVIIVRNVCYDMLKAVENDLSFIEDISQEEADSIVETEAQKQVLDISVNSLPEIYKDVIILRYYFGFSVSDISEQIGISYSGTKKRIAYALNMLRKEMTEDE